MARVLSSRWTFVYKFVSVPAWVVLFGGATLLAFRPQSWSPAEFETPLVQNLFLITAVFGLMVFSWLFVPLKRVELSGGVLRISNYLATIEVPLGDVTSVSGSILINPELIWIRFKDPTEFGEKIVFMGQYRLFSGFNRHPVVRELKQEIAKHR